MPQHVDGQTYYLAGEVAEAAEISRSTLTRWIKDERVADATLRNRNGWRLFTKRELNAILGEAQRVRRLSE